MPSMSVCKFKIGAFLSQAVMEIQEPHSFNEKSMRLALRYSRLKPVQVQRIKDEKLKAFPLLE